jgi:ABC-type anion transport system duplicated permease subunit
MTLSFYGYDDKHFLVGTEASTGEAWYNRMFEPIVMRVMEVFPPNAIVCCSAVPTRSLATGSPALVCP